MAMVAFISLNNFVNSTVTSLFELMHLNENLIFFQGLGVLGKTAMNVFVACYFLGYLRIRFVEKQKFRLFK